jgi:hypothetical protein
VESNRLTQLHEMESMAIEAAAKMLSGADELAIAIHEIFSKQLYLEELDDKGLPLYTTQKEYEPVLLRKLGISRATLYNHYTPLKIAAGPTFNLSYEDFIETGGKRMWANVADVVEYDRFTGEVTTEIPGKDVGEYILEQVRELAPSREKPELNLTPYELKREVNQRLNKLEIRFWLESNNYGGYSLKYEMVDNTDFLATEEGYISNYTPQEVVDELKKRLRIYD